MSHTWSNVDKDLTSGVNNHGFAVVLVDPQLGENIGACARVMLNFGFTDLRLVRPRDGWPSVVAERNASGAMEKGVDVTVYDTVDDALADRTYVMAVCPRLRRMVKEVVIPSQAVESLYSMSTQGHRTAVMFGAERSGLTNDDVAKAGVQIVIPANPVFSSLNIAQAVLVIVYEFFTHTSHLNVALFQNNESVHASQTTVQHLIDHFEGALQESGFFRAAGHSEVMKRNLRSLIARSQLTEQEAQTLRGVIKSLVSYHKT